MRIQRLRDKANSLPALPGVYIMKDADGTVIYVGKSKKLKNRVTTYFTGNNHTVKTARMVSLVEDFDYIVCNTEIEALTLENVLIKKHMPKYNIRLKDSKSYPYIKVTAEEYPRLFVTRDRKGEKGRYFGPYQGASSAYAALEAVVKVFSLPTCKRSFPGDIGRERPCIYKDMGRCIAPCAGNISADDYRARVKSAERVLDGNTAEAKAKLRLDMEYFAENLEFERAAAIRDQLLALDRLSEKQKVVADEKVNRDIFALYFGEGVGVLAMLSIRTGALVNKNEFILSAADPIGSEEAISLIADHYDGGASVPKEIMLAFDSEEEDISLLSEYLSLSAGHKITVKTPERGDGKALCNMALQNAMESARQYRLEGEREDKNTKRLTALLGLPESPRRIEAYDISNIGNENIVASMVVWSGGKLKKSDYRSFVIKNVSGTDDYACMRETLSRRFAHLDDESGSFADIPDLVLLDGGKTHVSTVRELLGEMGIEVPVFGMVKDEYHKTRALCDEKNEISIAADRELFVFIYKIQEEIHRYTVSKMTAAKLKSLKTSSLEKIKGIGEKKAKSILLKFGTLEAVKTAAVEELSKVKGVSVKDAESIFSYFHSSEEDKI